MFWAIVAYASGVLLLAFVARMLWVAFTDDKLWFDDDYYHDRYVPSKIQKYGIGKNDQ